MRWGLCAILLLAAGCEARLVLGSTCVRNAECPAGLVCDDGRCRVECVDQTDCSLGARCVRDPATMLGRCSLPDDPDCRTAGHACEAGLLCVGTMCVNACESTASCPGGSVCVPDAEGRAYCERADVDASIPRDAGVPDAGMDAPALDVPTGDDAPALDGGALDGGTCGGPGCDEPVALAVVPSGTCTLTESGAVWCWGNAGAVGTGEAYPACGVGTCAATPVRARVVLTGSPRDIAGAARIAGGGAFSAIEGGRLIGWGGSTTVGTMGGAEIGRLVRLAAGGFVPMSAEEVVQGHTAALVRMTGGALSMWGDDDFAQRGAGGGPGGPFAEPADPSPGGGLPSLGGWHGCAIGATGGLDGGVGDAGVDRRVRCWGENDYGQAGGVSTGPGAIVPTATVVPGVPNGASVVVAGRSQTCALVTGTVWCWGASYAIGTSAPSGCTTTGGLTACPARAITWAGGVFSALFGGPYSEDTCAVDSEGALYCWGARTGAEPTPIDVPTPVSFVAVSDLHACAIAGGDVYCWGANALGQLGRGFPGSPMPVPAVVAWPD